MSTTYEIFDSMGSLLPQTMEISTSFAANRNSDKYEVTEKKIFEEVLSKMIYLGIISPDQATNASLWIRDHDIRLGCSGREFTIRKQGSMKAQKKGLFVNAAASYGEAYNGWMETSIRTTNNTAVGFSALDAITDDPGEPRPTNPLD